MRLHLFDAPWVLTATSTTFTFTLELTLIKNRIPDILTRASTISVLYLQYTDIVAKRIHDNNSTATSVEYLRKIKLCSVKFMFNFYCVLISVKVHYHHPLCWSVNDKVRMDRNRIHLRGAGIFTYYHMCIIITLSWFLF